MKHAFQANHVFGGCTTCMALTSLVISRDLTYDVMHTLALWSLRNMSTCWSNMLQEMGR
jgi:hypothetical protein